MVGSFVMNVMLLRICVVILSLGLVVSCGTDDETALKADKAAVQAVGQASTLLQSGQKLSPEQFAKIKSIFEQYPDSKTAQDTYRAALIVKEDWAILADFFNKRPGSKLAVDDKLTLAKAYVKLGRYSDAAETLVPLTTQNSLEANALLANAYFHLGKYDDAKRLIDENWQPILNDKRADEIALRGMIYFYQGDAEKAIETLNKSIALSPQHLPSYNGLSRVYASRGDQVKAEENLKKVQELFDRITADERRKTNLVEKSYKLQEAYQAKQFQLVIDLANELLPQSDAKTKTVLYQFQYNSYQALGKQAEAQEVLSKARQLQQ